jgi:hypothetical protein
MTSEHLQALFFGMSSMRAAQKRLRQLWEHNYLDRCFITVSSGSPALLSARSGQPVYHLGKVGRAYLENQERTYLPMSLGQYPRRSVGITALDHHLLTTDFLVAIYLALKETEQIHLQEAMGEAVLWRRLTAWKKKHAKEKTLVPDGGFTICYPDNPSPCTFFVEIVRSGVKGGNRNLLKKLKDYVALHRRGFFQSAYGAYRLRAVLIVTSSRTRAENFRSLAKSLPYGQGLFWFGTYQTENKKRQDKQKDEIKESVGLQNGQKESRNTLTKELILTHRFQDVSGGWRSLSDPNHVRKEEDN